MCLVSFVFLRAHIFQPAASLHRRISSTLLSGSSLLVNHVQQKHAWPCHTVLPDFTLLHRLVPLRTDNAPVRTRLLLPHLMHL